MSVFTHPSVLIKKHLTDRALSPLREDILNKIKFGESIIDIGCGSGDLLLKASRKISYGIGIDIDVHMIRHAQHEKDKKRLNNLKFIHGDIINNSIPSHDIATCTLLIHSVAEETAIKILTIMLKASKKVIVADFDTEQVGLFSIFTELDELISGHYFNYRMYMKREGMFHYINKLSISVLKIENSKINGMTIWTLKGNR